MTLLPRINCFLKASGMSPTRFGREAVRDPRLLADLKRGREPGPRIVKRIDRFLKERGA